MRAFPILRVLRIERSLEFYGVLGFTLKSTYRPDPQRIDPAFCVIEKQGCEIHLSSHAGDGCFGSAVQIVCDSVDELYESLPEPVRELAELKPTNQTWNQRELYFRDLDNHSIRFISPVVTSVPFYGYLFSPLAGS